jgi:hypothetical protein
MAERIRRDRIGVPSKCIFCERKLQPGKTLSGEHLFSDWMKCLLPSPSANRREQVEQFKHSSDIGQYEFWDRHGAARGAKFHVVCQSCNNGWMSVIDNAIKPIIKPLIMGVNGIYMPQMQWQIAQWLALKLLVAEAAPKVGRVGVPIFDQALRSKFMKDRQVPPGFTMWLAPGGGPTWSESATIQTSGIGVSREPIPRVNLEKIAPFPQNIQTMTWGVGRVVFSIVAVSDPRLYPVNWGAPNGHTKLWPLIGGSLVYPPNFALTDWEITRISLRHQLRYGQAFPVRHVASDLFQFGS